MSTKRNEVEQQLKDFLFHERWIKRTGDFGLDKSFRNDLKFTKRDMNEMFFMTENEFDILITAQDEQETETIGDLVNLIIEKKNL